MKNSCVVDLTEDLRSDPLTKKFIDLTESPNPKVSTKSYLKPTENAITSSPKITIKSTSFLNTISERLKELHNDNEGDVSLDDWYEPPPAPYPKKYSEPTSQVEHKSHILPRSNPHLDIGIKKPQYPFWLAYKKTSEENALNELLRWKQNNLTTKSQEPEIPTKRERKEKEENDKIIKKQKLMLKLNDFMKQETDKKEREKQQKEKTRNKGYQEKELQEETKHMSESLSEEWIQSQLEANEKSLRFCNRFSIEEFYSFALSLDLQNLEGRFLANKQIPLEFKNGKFYKESFFPAFFDELRALVFCALSQANFSSSSLLELIPHSDQGDYGFIAPGEEKRGGEFSFYHSLKQDDLVLVFSLQETNNIPASFAELLNLKPIYFFGVCERENSNSSWMIKANLKKLEDIEFSKPFNVIYVDSLSTLIREFRMIKLAEFLDLNEFIMNPAKKSLISIPCAPVNYFRNIERIYNASQYDAIQKICSKTTGITLLQGPPGTGKTQTLLGIMSSFLLSKINSGEKPRLLVCAPSNAAIDELACRAIEQGLFNEAGNKRDDLSFVRIGNFNSQHLELRQKNPNDAREPPKSVQSIMLGNLVSGRLKKEGLIDQQEELNEIKKKLNNVERNINWLSKKINIKEKEKFTVEKNTLTSNMYRIKHNRDKYRDRRKAQELDILCKSDIIFCTLSGAGSKEIQAVPHDFDYVLIDEACQSIELSTLIPLQYKARHAVLVGDPRQLPATTFCQNSQNVLYNRSLFERLMQGGAEVIMLEIQYRMTKEICCFPSLYFYEGRLQVAEELDNREKPYWMPAQEVIFFDLKTSFESRTYDDTSIQNINEAEFIMGIYNHFSCIHRMKLNIGIITPYKKQAKLIRELLYKRYESDWKSDIEVNTVDGFQGREKDLIIFSAVRSGNTVGFLSDYRRMNVAITRAKFGLWIVGKAECLQRNELWQKLIESFKERNMFYECKSWSEVQSRITMPKTNNQNNKLPIKPAPKEPQRPREKAAIVPKNRDLQMNFMKKKTEADVNKIMERHVLDIINRK
ncbi:unnamed protein product [Blepharisma stoltei]|uniref:Uncharacterized protein n=1 Tax=Blepharisma stoltei TaxID=1481888 RepID=A0AAU9IA31_9CILI|nr:unnamed protein product [Blepharisma stoltei]